MNPRGDGLRKSPGARVLAPIGAPSHPSASCPFRPFFAERCQIMSQRVGLRLFHALICISALASIGAAADRLRINQRAKVGDSAELEPGTYRVAVERTRNSAEVLFFQGKDLVAAAHATFGKEDGKSNRTEIRSEEVGGERIITKIWLRGWKESLVFNQGTPEAE